MSARSRELATTLRFAAVGVAATLTYLAISLVLLRLNVPPQIANAGAFGLSLVLSYAGHYAFTFRSREAHTRTGTRFALATAALFAVCSGVLQIALWLSVPPRVGAALVAILYPVLSFLLNRFWSFSSGTRAGGQP
jgi:putative flippase GtrA